VNKIALEAFRDEMVKREGPGEGSAGAGEKENKKNTLLRKF
jgi:hypothetical protein